MTDVYVYYFTVPAGQPARNVGPRLRATLEAIKRIGEPVMESQMVADHTEVDRDGFLRTSEGSDVKPAGDATAEIRSLGLRADSRDTQAQAMNETNEGQDKYMLQLESRELRSQARKLQSRRVDVRAGDDAGAGDAPGFAADAGVRDAG